MGDREKVRDEEQGIIQSLGLTVSRECRMPKKCAPHSDLCSHSGLAQVCFNS